MALFVFDPETQRRRMRVFHACVFFLIIFTQNCSSFGYFEQNKGFSLAKKLCPVLKSERETSMMFTQISVKQKTKMNTYFNNKDITFQAASTSSISSRSDKDLLARLLGYIMGIGSMLLYSPILMKLLKNGSAEGFSVVTWISNVVGCTLAMAYPMKKGFPISTYLELVSATLQSIGILALLCFYEGKIKEFSIGLSVLSIFFLIFQKLSNLPAHLLGFVQIAASLIANYANIPQIILTFQTKKASWSGITAFLSVAGCLVRIFTTVQLTKDPFVIAGYMLGIVTNGLLLAQVIMYR